MKRCNSCLEKKDIKDFYMYKTRVNKNNKNIILNHCKECKKKISNDMYKLKKLYNKPIHNYCYCCKKYCEKLILDHDHNTNQFRGWLCKSCNVGIGYLKDNIEGVKMAYEYLKQSSI